MISTMISVIMGFAVIALVVLAPVALVLFAFAAAAVSIF